jgi:hypothetical protein
MAASRNYHSLAYAIYANGFDPLVVIAHTRHAMARGETEGLQAAARDIRRRAYADARDRVRKRAWLPDRKTRTALDAGLRVLERWAP